MSKLQSVAGKTYSRNQFVRLIADTIDRLAAQQPEEFGDKGAGALDIIAVWCDEWWSSQEGRQALRLQLGSLTRRGLLDRLSEGRYLVSPKYRRAANSGEEAIVQSIIADLKENGGVMSFTEIREGFGIEPHRGGAPVDVELLKRRTPKALAKAERVRTTYLTEKGASGGSGYLWRIIREAPELSRDFRAFNLVNLSYPLLDQIVLEGRVAYMQTYAAVKDAMGVRPTLRLKERPENAPALRPDETPEVEAPSKGSVPKAFLDRVDEAAGRLFRNVGRCFAEAREDRDWMLGELTEQPGVMGQIGAVAARHPFRVGFEGYMLARERGDKWGDNIPEAFVEARTTRDWPLVVYAMFEDGDVDTHKLLPTRFYAILARALRLDPIQASRGVRRVAQPDRSTYDLEDDETEE